MAALILNHTGFCNLALTHQPINSKIQFRHDCISASDTADGTGNQTGKQLLIRTVEDDGSFVPPHFNVLHGHGGVLHANDIRILQHLPQKGAVQRNAGELGNVVNHKVGIRSCG